MHQNLIPSTSLGDLAPPAQFWRAVAYPGETCKIEDAYQH
jgi:hypothetical protein